MLKKKINAKCDLCSVNKAKYDGKTILSSWAYMCPKCFDKYGIEVKGLYTVINDEVNENELFNMEVNQYEEVK